MSSCTQPGFSDALLGPLRALRRLDVSHCTQLALSGVSLEALAGRSCGHGPWGPARPLESLCVDFCTQESLSEANLLRLRGAVKVLTCRGCRQLSRATQRGWADRVLRPVPTAQAASSESQCPTEAEPAGVS